MTNAQRRMLKRIVLRDGRFMSVLQYRASNPTMKALLRKGLIGTDRLGEFWTATERGRDAILGFGTSRHLYEVDPLTAAYYEKLRAEYAKKGIT